MLRTYVLTKLICPNGTWYPLPSPASADPARLPGMERAYRVRRSCLSVPASSERFIAKARDLPADEVFLDLEDAVAPSAKDAARGNAVAALTSGAWRAGIRAVRVNDATTPWAYQDVVALVEGAGDALDAIVL